MNVIQSPSQNPSQHQEFLPIRRTFTQSIQKDRYNGNGNAVDDFSASLSESSLVSPMQASIHDNNLSSNSKGGFPLGEMTGDFAVKSRQN